MAQGLTRHDAIHAIASVLTDHLYENAHADSRDTGDVFRMRYESAVETLTAQQWLTKYGEP